VLAVIFFIIIGAGAIFGIVSMEGEPAPFFSNFSADGGLFPFGISIVFVTMMNVVFSYQGSELIGIAAGETENPQKNIPRAIRNVIFRILIFYVASVTILSALFPSSELGLLESPFVTVFDAVGIPYAADIMNFVILTALLSVGNSCLYASTRLLWALSHSGMAHPVFGKLTKRSVPLNSLLMTLAFSLLSLLTSVLAADTVYVLLMSVSGIAITFCWMGIALSQFNFRRQYLREGGKVEDLQFAAPFYPAMPILCLALCTFLMVYPIFDATQRFGLFYGIGALVVFYLYYYLRYGRHKDKRPHVPTQG
jgi:arginine/ornithine permease